jgi:hypothetical protein
MKKNLLPAILVFFSFALTAQSEYQVGVSYRYIRYNEAMVTLNRMHGEYLDKNELDLHFRFPVDKRLYGTLTLGWARYYESDFLYDNPLFQTCDSPYEIDAIAQDQHAYRFNPGIEYEVNHGKWNYGFGAGIFYYGTFRGTRLETYTTSYMHTDSQSGDCIEDSLYIRVVTGVARAKTMALIGLSGNLFAGYEPVPGITFFAAFSVNPVFSTTNHYFALTPSGSVGLYFRFKRRAQVN